MIPFIKILFKLLKLNCGYCKFMKIWFQSPDKLSNNIYCCDYMDCQRKTDFCSYFKRRKK